MKRLLLYAAIAFSVFSLTYHSKKEKGKEATASQVVETGAATERVKAGVELP